MSLTKVPAQVDQAVVRSNALLTIFVSMTAILTGTWWVMAALAVDFVIRGFLNPRMSLLSIISGNLLVRIMPFTRKMIFFPPKRFAARVGLVFATASALLLAFELTGAATVVLLTLSVFAALECFLNICMGCIVYDILIAPHRRSSDLP